MLNRVEVLLRALELIAFEHGEIPLTGKAAILVAREALRIYNATEDRPTKDAAELALRSARGVGLQAETSCKNCGHSKSRHETAGGFCKHCNCNEFVESTMPPIR